MRITLVAPFDPDPGPGPAARANGHVGGVERVFAQISHRLARRGHDVTLVCSADGRAGLGFEDGVRIVREPRRLTILRTPVARLARHVTPDADVVHVAATYPFTTPRVLRRARALRVPAVLDFHFEPAPASLVGRVAAAAYRGIGPRAYPLADAVLVRSRAYARASGSLARVPETRWRVVPNGVDVDRFRPLGPAPPGDYVLFVGRLVPYKGLDVLLHALARWPGALPLVVAGDGPLRHRLEGLARRLGVKADFRGHVPDEDLPALYRGARITVLPSVNRQEAFGLALLESIACGTPVVASALPGVEDLARLGGLVAPPGDPDALAIRLVRATHVGRLPRGPELAARARQDYSWDAVADRLVAVYAEVCNRPAPPASTAPILQEDPDAHPRGHALL